MAVRARLRQARVAALATLFAAVVAAQAQAPGQAQMQANAPARAMDLPGANPADAKAPVPPVVHSPAFAGYRPHLETKVAPWRDVNDEVGRIGGWKAYAREAYEAAQAAQAAARAQESAPPAMHRHDAKPPS